MSLYKGTYISEKVTLEEANIIGTELQDNEKCLSVYSVTLLGKYLTEDEQVWRKFEQRCLASLNENEHSELYLKVCVFDQPAEPVKNILSLKLQSAFHVHMDLQNIFSFNGEKYTLGLSFHSPKEDIENFMQSIQNLLSIPEKQDRNSYKKTVDKAVKRMKYINIERWLLTKGEKKPTFFRRATLMRKARQETGWVKQEFWSPSNENGIFISSTELEQLHEKTETGISQSRSSSESSDFSFCDELGDMTLNKQIKYFHRRHGKRISTLYAAIPNPLVITRLQKNGECRSSKDALS